MTPPASEVPPGKTELHAGDHVLSPNPGSCVTLQRYKKQFSQIDQEVYRLKAPGLVTGRSKTDLFSVHCEHRELRDGQGPWSNNYDCDCDYDDYGDCDYCDDFDDCDGCEHRELRV